MLHRLRISLGLALALLVGVTGIGLAAARGQSPAAGQIVICAGLTTLVIWTDAEGNPTSAPHTCPDAAPAYLADTSAAMWSVDPIAVSAVEAGPVPGALLMQTHVSGGRARAPPSCSVFA